MKMERNSIYPLRLPVALEAAVGRLSERDGTGMNQFMVVAVAEKIAAKTTEGVFAERLARVDQSAVPGVVASRTSNLQTPIAPDSLGFRCRPWKHGSNM